MWNSLLDELQKISAVTVVAPDLSGRERGQLLRRFNYLADMMEREGPLVGTGHKRVLIPKSKLTQDDLGGLGFVPVSVAIPESGQSSFRSFRHPDTTYHVHEHGDDWTMHRDEHAAATMLAKKENTVGGKAKAHFKGVPHVLTEGLPGAYYYLKGQVMNSRPMAERIREEMNPLALKKVMQLRDRLESGL